MAEAAGESHFPTILLWHSRGRRKGDPKHKSYGKNHQQWGGTFSNPEALGKTLKNGGEHFRKINYNSCTK